MTEKTCKTYFGGYRLNKDNCPVNNYSLLILDEHKNKQDFFTIKGNGKYQSENDKQWERIGIFINKILQENQRLKEEKKIILSLERVMCE